MSDLIAKAAIDRRLLELLEPTITDMGFEIIRVRLMSGNVATLQLMVERPDGGIDVDAVSYTHLTLPTTPYV